MPRVQTCDIVFLTHFVNFVLSVVLAQNLRALASLRG